MGHLVRRERSVKADDLQRWREAREASKEDWAFFHRDLELSEIRKVIEFELAIDRITQPDCELRPDIQLYKLDLGRSRNIGFELSFMLAAAVVGTFPSSQLVVAFVEKGNGIIEQWPIEYRWSGAKLNSHTVPQDTIDSSRLAVTYQYDSLETAFLESRDAENS